MSWRRKMAEIVLADIRALKLGLADRIVISNLKINRPMAENRIITRCITKAKGMAITTMLLSMAFAFPSKKIKVYMVGDSTMCLYPTKQLPINAGNALCQLFRFHGKDRQPGPRRSQYPYIPQRRQVAAIADSLEEGDYVLIQFGHNDESSQPQYADRYTPVPDYKTNLIKFITETRSKKAIPSSSLRSAGGISTGRAMPKKHMSNTRRQSLK